LGARLLPYIRTLARHGLKKALLTEPGLVPAISLYKGKITNRYFADYYRDEFYNIFELLELNL
jgi:alanine dehydrogenase